MEQPTKDGSHNLLDLEPTSTMGPGLNGECETCVQLLGVFNGRIGESITLKDVPRLVNGGICNVHEKFFQRLQKLCNLQNVLYDNGPKSSGRYVRFDRTASGKIQLRSDYGFQGELLISRHGGRIPVEQGIARIVDREWIDADLMKNWKNLCESEHDDECSPTNHGNLPRPRIPWVVDTVEQCLVRSDDKASYVTLSYVWGGHDTLKIVMENLERFCQPGAFHEHLPKTVRDAMGVVRLLGERYLWVDALCIVQDDEIVRHTLIHAMTAVYANAVFTIVAADGRDADAGLRGLRGLTPARDNPCILEWPDGTCLNWPGSSGLSCAPWNERGWTFPEYLFSRRRLIFVADSVRWECGKGCLWEEHCQQGILPTPETSSQYEPDYAPIRRATRSAVLAFADMVAFRTLVDGFNDRKFTFPDDPMDAFSGVLTALAPKFIGSFLWGNPVMFLDLALLWRTDKTGRRRWDPRLQTRHDKHAPTWSWASWQGNIETALVWRNEDWLLFSRDEWFYNVDPIRRIVPIVRWSIRKTKYSVTSEASLDIPYQNEWHVLKTRYSVPTPPPPPPGWTRWPIEFGPNNSSFSLKFDIEMQLMGSSRAHTLDPAHDKYPPRYYYTHNLTKTSKFCYPIPLPEEGERTTVSEVVSDGTGRYLCGSTHRAFFKMGVRENEDIHAKREITDPESPDELAGYLYADEPSDDDGLALVELVALSLKYKNQGCMRWEQPFGAEVPQFYNVLWVVWIDGVAYRKGVGEVKRDVWEQQVREPIELILG